MLDQGADDYATLGMLLAAAHGHSRRTFNEGLRSVGIESRHFGVLRALDRHGPASQRRLIELLALDKSAMVRIVDELERQGLVERTRDPHDRRAYAIVLSAEGRRRLTAAAQVATEVGDHLFGHLTPEERIQLHNLLTRLTP